MSADEHLNPQQFAGDELASRRKQKFNAILDQVPTFDEEIERHAAIMKTEYERLQRAKKPKRPSLRVVK